jgi:hypothetical protein
MNTGLTDSPQSFTRIGATQFAFHHSGQGTKDIHQHFPL